MAFVFKPHYNIFDIISPIIKIAVGGNGIPVFNFRGADVGYLGQTDKYAFSVYITKTSFYVIF
jgi:hypothetical protein